MKDEIELVVKKIKRTFVKHEWVIPRQRLEIFTKSLEKILIESHDRYPPSDQLKEIKKLENKFEATQTIIRKTHKSKIFYLGKIDDYKVKAQAYMFKTKAYQDLGNMNPLESLVERTNNFLHDLWVYKHIAQNQYEKLKVKKRRS